MGRERGRARRPRPNSVITRRLSYSARNYCIHRVVRNALCLLEAHWLVPSSVHLLAAAAAIHITKRCTEEGTSQWASRRHSAFRTTTSNEYCTTFKPYQRYKTQQQQQQHINCILSITILELLIVEIPLACFKKCAALCFKKMIYWCILYGIRV